MPFLAGPRDNRNVSNCENSVKRLESFAESFPLVTVMVINEVFLTSVYIARSTFQTNISTLAVPFIGFTIKVWYLKTKVKQYEINGALHPRLCKHTPIIRHYL